MGVKISVAVVAFWLWGLEFWVHWISSYPFCYRFRIKDVPSCNTSKSTSSQHDCNV